MSVNTELLKKTLDMVCRAAETPVQQNGDTFGWDQEFWVHQVTEDEGREFCGTAMCFAGWAVWLDGYTKPVTEDRYGSTVGLRNPKTGVEVSKMGIEGMAKDLLGLNWDEAERLFNHDNDLEDLTVLVKQITEQASE